MAVKQVKYYKRDGVDGIAVYKATTGDGLSIWSMTGDFDVPAWTQTYKKISRGSKAFTEITGDEAMELVTR